MSGGDGGIRTLQAHNDDGAEEFNVIDISKLKTVVAETGVSRNIPPKPALTPSKPKPFRPLIEGANGAREGMRAPETQRPFKDVQYCGHVRCDKCLPDKWSQLADGCWSCRARILAGYRLADLLKRAIGN
jgi:hypothetical protein